MRLALALALTLAAEPVSAHCFSVWHYPWRQNCRVSAHQHAGAIAQVLFRRK